VQNAYLHIPENLHYSDIFALLPPIRLSVVALTYLDLLSSDLLHLRIKSNCFFLKSSRFCFFSPEVRANKTTPLPWSPYQMVLRINDTSLKPGHGHSYVSSFLCELVLKTEFVPVPKYHAVSWMWSLSFAFRPPFSRVKWHSYPLKSKLNVTWSWFGLCGEQVVLCLSGISHWLFRPHPASLFSTYLVLCPVTSKFISITDTCIPTVNTGNFVENKKKSDTINDKNFTRRTNSERLRLPFFMSKHSFDSSTLGTSKYSRV
jgi:hypothetical protein